ncbi:intermembrane lipid transfer protein Vps13-like isoform X2 [Daktulosphaira vitifoliae]|uniref:intermembrane lipid transfer protein Vps13-like isoform X2 n=1 Tax=Daktulosphaira vitifoliae TaxID=58002 RepID=UPI0021AAE918|nr:intermembrane lipid transfer protein Vps13-like isoform X2 [Daktulosphaira vitifoliae]
MLFKLIIFHKDILEVTLTKLSIEDVSNLIEHYTEAIFNKKEFEIIASNLVPFVIKNRLGFDLIIFFENTPLQMYNSEKISSIVLKNDENLKLIRKLKIDIMFLIGRKHLFNDCNLIIRFNDTQPEKYFELNMNTTSKRYFENMPIFKQIFRPWVLITDTVVVGGSMEVTLRSNVQVHNNLWCNIKLYIISNDMTEVKCIGSINPNEILNIPVYALHTEKNELFLKLNGYFTCTEPFIWSEMQNKNITKLLKCLPSELHNNPYYIKIVGFIERVCFEETNSYKTGCHCIHIHVYPTYVFMNELPTVIFCNAEGYTETNELLSGKITNITLPQKESSVICLSV